MKNSVWPSGGAAVRSRNAGIKIPPARFSTNTVVRRLSLIFCATSRAITSVAPPAASPTMSLIGFAESSCAGAAAGASSTRPASRATRPNGFMFPSRAVFSSVTGQQRRRDALARQRQIAQAYAERPRHRIADGRGRRSHRGLADAERRLVRRVDEADLDLRHLGEFQDRIIVPGGRGDAAVVEPHLLLQGPTRRLDDAALDLI